MSLWVHVGQAGIQIGHQFWKLVNESCESKNTNNLNKNETTAQQFFLRSGRARSILVDTEPKVQIPQDNQLMTRLFVKLTNGSQTFFVLRINLQNKAEEETIGLTVLSF